MKARRAPSGDQAGWQAPSRILVNWCRFFPAASTTQICMVPDRFELKAICEKPPPSGVGVGEGVMVGVSVAWEGFVGLGETVSDMSTAGSGVVFSFWP